ncbi:MAG: hypothetical protein HQK60_02025 [Deltaproteobacteria bacterium]|nr:hypothetical protein [Deltaproteobacteria bacterium]
MTLCMAWIRENRQEKELVMATDSRLTGGERWDNGVKLFELPRMDCLLCFAGDTFRAYPLILNSISSIKFDSNLSSLHTDILDVLNYLVDLFSTLVGEIKDPPENDGDFSVEAQFLFGGWSWREQKFCIWRLYYEPELKAFIHDSVNTNDDVVCIFIGNDIEEAKGGLETRLQDAGNIPAGALDMEPLQVLAQMSRDAENYQSIGGAIQIAKVYQSGSSEFFGVMWPSVNGGPTFLGRQLSEHDMPPVRFFDPDLATILEDALPENLNEIDKVLYGDEYEFMMKCYPEGRLKAEMSDRERKKLKKLIQSVAYRKYCSDQLEVREVADEQANQ